MSHSTWQRTRKCCCQTSFYRTRCGFFWGVLSLFLILYVLFWGDNVGMSDNGDFHRVMRASSLRFGEQTPTFTYVETYMIDLSPDTPLSASLCAVLLESEEFASYPSLHVLVVRLSTALNLLLNWGMGWKRNIYHISILGVLYAVLYAVGIGFLLSRFFLRQWWCDALFKAAALFVLCDSGYTAYFNSFYGEALEHIALIYCAALLIQTLFLPPKPLDALWCALAAIAYGWSKFFHLPVAILLTVIMEGVILVRTGQRWAVVLGGAALVFLLAVWSATPDWMDTETSYNAVFYGVIRDVDIETARSYLASLGLPEELADYRDTNYYLPDIVDSLNRRGLLAAATSVKKTDLLRFYLTHPARLLEQARLTALHCGMIRPFYLANLGEGYPLMSDTSRMSVWGTLRDWLALDTLGGNLLAMAALPAAVLIVSRRKVTIRLLLPLLALMGGLVYTFFLPIMLNGEGDLAKHMFAYIELSDLTMLATVAVGLYEAGWGRMVCFTVAGALILPSVGHTVSGIVRENTAHDRLEPGAYVKLGSYQGKDLVWLVVEQYAGVCTLFCMREDIVLPFDQAGGNDWRYSSARAWLNEGFLEEFSEDERALLRPVTTPLLLTERHRGDAVSGDLEFGYSHIARLADRGYDRGYQTVVEDLVGMPGVDLIARLARAGNLPTGGEYWLKTPYCRVDRLARYVGEDGHIYFGDVQAGKCFRGIIAVCDQTPVSGSGSRKKPFRLTFDQ